MRNDWIGNDYILSCVLRILIRVYAHFICKRQGRDFLCFDDGVRRYIVILCIRIVCGTAWMIIYTLKWITLADSMEVIYYAY